jgi:hypothetical protein
MPTSPRLAYDVAAEGSFAQGLPFRLGPVLLAIAAIAVGLPHSEAHADLTWIAKPISSGEGGAVSGIGGAVGGVGRAAGGLLGGNN